LPAYIIARQKSPSQLLSIIINKLASDTDIRTLAALKTILPIYLVSHPGRFSFLQHLLSISTSGIESLENIITWNDDGRNRKDLFSFDARWSTLNEGLTRENLKKVILDFSVKQMVGDDYHRNLENKDSFLSFDCLTREVPWRFTWRCFFLLKNSQWSLSFVSSVAWIFFIVWDLDALHLQVMRSLDDDSDPPCRNDLVLVLWYNMSALVATKRQYHGT
jgi:hypothetical protein